MEQKGGVSKRLSKMRRALPSPLNGLDSDGLSDQACGPKMRQASLEENKGAISMLQEFVQFSKGFHVPPRCPILQWMYDTRMADSLTLEFRATVSFLLEGIPHHVGGEWHPSKKMAQRDTAERTLSFFVGCWGDYQQCAEDSLSPLRHCSPSCSTLGSTPSTATGGWSRGELSLPNSPDALAMTGSRPDDDSEGITQDEMKLLEHCCRRFQACDAPVPQWSVRNMDGLFQACVEIEVLGVPHKFFAGEYATKDEACRSTARRVLWYLSTPEFESAFEPADVQETITASGGLPVPQQWANSACQDDALEVAARKTAIMRLQNRLQQALARQLKPGQSVWEWSYETDANSGWPLLCRASVNIPVVGKQFTGSWARGQRNAQIAASTCVTDFLDSIAGSESDCQAQQLQAPTQSLKKPSWRKPVRGGGRRQGCLRELSQDNVLSPGPVVMKQP
eukprot:TRINITY_DN13848_c0_g1_i1.p1 TRINITY_DN13848_c0_g1~~TRINITY_DN13848_c0_g1_i1.p1  ORF type:complete len:450 (-),score=70.77 TRINITY_DN13848_c0_g1_i1:74-1423(-)